MFLSFNVFISYIWLDTSSHLSEKGIDKKKRDLIKKIENILDDINKNANNGTTPKLVLRNQKLWSNCIYDLDR